jgi:hypothetical protein
MISITTKRTTLLWVSIVHILSFVCLNTTAAQDCGCDHILTQSGIYRPRPTHVTSNNPFLLPVTPGQTICIQAGTYGDVRFYGFEGTATEPIRIKNCGGRVNLSNNFFHGLSFADCRYLIISGNSDPQYEYGIRIEGTGSGGSGLIVTGKSSDITVEHVEVAGSAFAGIMIKNDPTCDPTTWRDSFTMRNIIVRHNYIHDVVGEGFYIGNSFFTEGYPTICGGAPQRVFPHRILGLQIYDNLTRRTGCEGIQYGCAPDAVVRDNVVEDAGIMPFDVFQNNGIQIGDGCGGACHHNVINRARGGGISAVGNIGNVRIANNLILRSGTTGIYVDDNAATPLHSKFEIYNNSIITSGGDGIHLRNERNNNFVRNNALVATGLAAYITYMEGASATATNNLTTAFVNTANYIDTLAYRPSPASPTINVGLNLTAEGLTDDLLGTPRPSGAAFDIGAYEAVPCTGRDNTAPILRNCPKNFTVYTRGSSTQVTWTLPTASDNCGIPTLTSNLQPNTNYSLGTRTVTYTAKDASGNRATCSFKFTVARTTNCNTDNISPTLLNCPRDTIINPTSYPVFVNWTPPTATDNCELAFLGVNYPPTTPFNRGQYTVTYTARDVRGNQTMCSFNLIVANLNSQCDIDTTRPFFTRCPTDTTVLTTTRNAVVTWQPPLAFDNCIVPIVRSNYIPGQTFSVGSWQVLYVARDLRNNVDSCRFRIRVLNPCDTERVAPIIRNCPSNLTVNTSLFYATPTWQLPTATDNCVLTAFSSNFQPNTVWGIGTRTVVYTARDQAGNTATCQFSVSVVNVCLTDTLPPVLINCPQDTTILTTLSSEQVNWTAPTATDNCTQPPSVFSNIIPNSFFGIGTRRVVYSAVDTRGNMAQCGFNVTIAPSAPHQGLVQRRDAHEENRNLVKTYKLYPNPSEDGYTILQINLNEAAPVQLNIFDSHGNLVKSRQLKGQKGLNEWQLDFSNFPAGIYFLTPSVKWLNLKPIRITKV